MDDKARQIVMDALRRYGVTDGCAAEDVRSALAAAAYKVLPREPNEAMVEHGAYAVPTPARTWRVMWDAAP